MPRLILTFLLFTLCPLLHAQMAKQNQANTDDMWVASSIPELPTGVTPHTFRRESMKREVGCCICLPPGYATDKERRYPVIYHLHGAGGNETRSVYSASVLHEGIVEGKLPEIVMVFPNGGRSTMYQDSGDGRFMAETMMIKKLIPHIDATHSKSKASITIRRRRSTAAAPRGSIFTSNLSNSTKSRSTIASHETPAHHLFVIRHSTFVIFGAAEHHLHPCR